MKKIQILLLKNEMPHDHDGWVLSFRKFDQIEFKIIEIFADNWIELIQKEDFDVLVLRPPGRSSFFKQMYDDRVQLLTELYPGKLYPNIDLIKIYENKRYFRDWMLIRNIPHPKTWVFFSKEDAFQFLNTNKNYPLVSKLNIGASGKGVFFLRNKVQAFSEISKLFGEGKRILGAPNLKKGSLLKKIKKILKNPSFVKARLYEYKQQSEEIHKNYCIFQEFIEHSFEWRCVVIGDSYFAHKKLVIDGKSSGTLLKDYGNPPFEILDFVRALSMKHGIDSAAIDIFEHNGAYLVNEIQSFFGQSDRHQMYVDNVPGRYYFENGKCFFEEGSFNDNQCYDLRVKHLLKKFDCKKK
ncbi:MAG: RimK family alpha-L-glutamate ligase [Bacteroidota bacterium]